MSACRHAFVGTVGFCAPCVSSVRSPPRFLLLRRAALWHAGSFPSMIPSFVEP